MSITEKRKKQMIEYSKEHLKRVPLDLTKDKYDQVKEYADKIGESVNGFIKTAIDRYIEDINEWERQDEEDFGK